jgi:hypothetical protein
MCCFIVGLPLDVRFEIDDEVDVIWSNDIDPIDIKLMLLFGSWLIKWID